MVSRIVTSLQRVNMSQAVQIGALADDRSRDQAPAVWEATIDIKRLRNIPIEMFLMRLQDNQSPQAFSIRVSTTAIA